MWIKWIHEYDIKEQQLATMKIPQQASWLVRKMIEARDEVEAIQRPMEGKCSTIRQLYLIMLGQQPRVEWKMFMFRNEARAKAKFTMGLYFQDRMMTSDRLHKWGIQVDKDCVLCKVHEETRNHIFVECEYIKRVWGKLLKWMQKKPFWQTEWNQRWKWAKENAKGRSIMAGIFKMVYTEVIHAIWNERNYRIFQKQNKAAEELARRIAYVCNVRATKRNRQMIQ
ncbi:PREDICTED: uncharacterized protein LOC109221079 [Nicotiana attenuata]|uniref:uncharacterized protein LOC109221079 n=1 Tax=Nicotiana attenuata TaxID=49451 RepID=UPI0009058D56|nr:PREDICTED: uncharacterized protein LOC109221079 [Nicotiana attenuata]